MNRSASYIKRNDVGNRLVPADRAKSTFETRAASSRNIVSWEVKVRQKHSFGAGSNSGQYCFEDA